MAEHETKIVEINSVKIKFNLTQLSVKVIWHFNAGNYE